MKRDSLTFARAVVMMAAVMVLIIAASTWVDLTTWGYSWQSLTAFDYAEARFLTDVTNRGLNQLLAVTFTIVAIAVPLTANLYSPKFVEFFIKDRINAALLAVVVLADLASFWLVFSLKQDFVPYYLLYGCLALLGLCLCLLFPYLHYVFRFLHPTTLLHRLEDEQVGAVRAVARRPGQAAERRKQLADGVEHIANIAVRSIERTDRSTAIEALLTVERVAQAYWAIKASLPEAWFTADPDCFRGYSSQALKELSANRSWVEAKLFLQLRGILSAAVPRTHDVAEMAARTLRHLGLDPAVQGDAALRDLAVEYFNTFIRLALTRRDARTAFTLFEHYQRFAQTINAEQPALVLEIAYYLEYYGQLAREQQLPFLVETSAHDVGLLAQHGWETNAPNRHKLLERLLHFDHKGGPPLPGVKKAQAILASYLMLAGEAEAAGLIRQSFVDLDRTFTAALAEELLHVRREKYWEISGRALNIDYVPDAQREKLREFFDGLLASGNG